jgi:hypothetical protein
MYKNRIRGLRRRTSWPMTTKSVSIKGAGGKSGGRVPKAVELIAGELLHGLEFGTEDGVIHPDPEQQSAAGVVLTRVRKAQTVRVNGRTSNSGVALRQPISFG